MHHFISSSIFNYQQLIGTGNSVESKDASEECDYVREKKTDASVNHNSSVFNMWGRERESNTERERGRSNYPENILKLCDRKRALCGNNRRADRLCDRERDIKTYRGRERESFVWITTNRTDCQMREEEEKSFTLRFGFLLVWRRCETTVHLQHVVTQISEHHTRKKTHNIFFYTEISSPSFAWSERSISLICVVGNTN